MKLPAKVTIAIPETKRIKDPQKIGREWCGSLLGAMVWLSGIIPLATYVFRGHADAKWDLQSSLFRSTRVSTLEKLEAEEAAILREVSKDYWFRREFGFHAAEDRDASDYERTIAALQHHGVPTRLIDATADPLVALYFAVTGLSAPDDMDNADGAVVMVRSVGEKDGLPIHVFSPPQVSERITAQRSRFIAPVKGSPANTASRATVAVDFFHVDVANGSDTAFNELGNKLRKETFRGRPPEKAPNALMFRVPARVKVACREALRGLGVSAASLFPGSEGFKKDLRGF